MRKALISLAEKLCRAVLKSQNSRKSAWKLALNWMQGWHFQAKNGTNSPC
jgi:hypothetical protein